MIASAVERPKHACLEACHLSCFAKFVIGTGNNRLIVFSPKGACNSKAQAKSRSRSKQQPSLEFDAAAAAILFSILIDIIQLDS